MVTTELDPAPLLLTTDPDRPVGLHLSDILHSLLVQTFPDKYGQPLHVPKIESGISWERMLERQLAKSVPSAFRPPSFLVDDIWVSPDLVWPEAWAPIEIKLTWYSMSKSCPDDPVFRPWIWQLMGYAHAMQTLQGYLFAQFINGDYKPPKPAPPRLIHLAWTPQEDAENWLMITNERDRMLARGWTPHG